MARTAQLAAVGGQTARSPFAYQNWHPGSVCVSRLRWSRYPPSGARRLQCSLNCPAIGCSTQRKRWTSIWMRSVRRGVTKVPGLRGTLR